MPTASELAPSMKKKSEHELFDIIKNPATWSEEAIEAARKELNSREVEVPNNIGAQQSEDPISPKRPGIKLAGIFMLIHVLAGGLFLAFASKQPSTSTTPIIIDLFLGAWLLGASSSKVESARRFTVFRACGSAIFWPIVLVLNLNTMSQASFILSLLGVLLVSGSLLLLLWDNRDPHPVNTSLHRLAIPSFSIGFLFELSSHFMA